MLNNHVWNDIFCSITVLTRENKETAAIRRREIMRYQPYENGKAEVRLEKERTHALSPALSEKPENMTTMQK